MSLRIFTKLEDLVAARNIVRLAIITFEKALKGLTINQFFDIIIPEFNVGVISQDSIRGSKKH